MIMIDPMHEEPFRKFSGRNGEPTELEQQFIAACAVGEHGEGRSIGNIVDAMDYDADEGGETPSITVSADLLVALVTGSFKHPDWPDWKLHKNGVVLAGARVVGEVNLAVQKIETRLYFEDCHFLEKLNFEKTEIGGDLVISSCINDGALSLSGATVDGKLDLSNSDFQFSKGYSINAADLRAHSLSLSSARIHGSVHLENSEISGTVDFSSIKIVSTRREALKARGLSAGQLKMSFADIEGNVDFALANFDGLFFAHKVKIKSESGVAMSAYLANFNRGLFLRADSNLVGSVDLSGSIINRGLELTNSKFTGDRGFALRLDGAQIDGRVTFKGSEIDGTIYAQRMRTTGTVHFGETKIRSTARCESAADETNALPSQDLVLASPFRDTAHLGINLQDAQIDGRLILPETAVEGVVDLSHARCAVLEDRAEAWPNPFISDDNKPRERRPLKKSVEARDAQHFVLSGFTYQYFAHPGGQVTSGSPSASEDIAKARIRWLSSQSAEDLYENFNPQPWRQAAAVLREMGHDRASQIVAIQRRVRERYSRDTPLQQRIINRVLHVIADYGYNPWKTLAYCLVAVLAFALIHGGAVAICGSPNSGEVRASCSAPIFVPVRYGDVEGSKFTSTYPQFEPISYSLGTFVPIFDLGAETFWRANSLSTMTVEPIGMNVRFKLPAGQILYWLFVFERILGGILIAITITGFTGMLTREDK